MIEADQLLMEHLQLNHGDKVLQSHKIFTADGMPVIYVSNSIPAYLLPEDMIRSILSSPEITEPLYEFFEDCCGKRIEYHIATVSAEIAGKINFPDIPLENEEPLLVIEETAYCADDKPLWHSMEYFPQNNQITFNIIRLRN
jgi:GntR family transcriptional regulator